MGWIFFTLDCLANLLVLNRPGLRLVICERAALLLGFLTSKVKVAIELNLKRVKNGMIIENADLNLIVSWIRSLILIDFCLARVTRSISRHFISFFSMQISDCLPNRKSKSKRSYFRTSCCCHYLFQQRDSEKSNSRLRPVR